MVLESLLNPTRPEHRPFSLLIIGFVYATVGLFLGLWIFEEYASMIMIFLTVMAAIPLIFATITFEEEKDDHIEKETTLLREHAKALDRKSTRLNSSHSSISYAVFCLKKKQ